MRIDKYIDFIDFKSKNYIVSYRTGSIDELDIKTKMEIEKLRNLSFMPKDVTFGEPLIEYMVERGYVNSYNTEEGFEELLESCKSIKEANNLQKKTTSIVLDYCNASNWCEYNSSFSETYDFKKIESIINCLKNTGLSNSIDLWFNPKNNYEDKVIDLINKNNLGLNSAYITIDVEISEKEIIALLNKGFSRVNIKKNNDNSIFSYNLGLDNNLICKREKLFMANQSTFCSFLNKTVFVFPDGDMSFCVVKGKKEIGKFDFEKRDYKLSKFTKNEHKIECKDCKVFPYCDLECSHLNKANIDLNDKICPIKLKIRNISELNLALLIKNNKI